MWLLDRLLRGVINTGELTITTAGGRVYRYGEPQPGRPCVSLRFVDERVPFDIVYDPGLGAGEAYMDGRMIIEQGDPLALVDLFQGDTSWERRGTNESAPARLLNQFRARAGRLNWQRRSKRNVAHHYNLSDRLYDLFLDADRQYSCAYFINPANDLDEAQADKKAHIAAKLYLKPGQKVLDIGCGWGGLAFYLNKVADVDVVGITLSEEQLNVARRRAVELGVQRRVTFELMDYRKVTGQFDRIVSVGMFEHVGPPHYATYFHKCRDLLTQDGVILLHTIGRLGRPGVTDRWTNKWIFPGGYNPALSEAVTAIERTRLIVTDVETLRLHYAYTLKFWYDRVVAQRDAIEALYDARFYRMWQFYLAGAWAAFRHGGLANYQIQLTRSRDALPITRDYITTAEAEFRAAARAGASLAIVSTVPLKPSGTGPSGATAPTPQQEP